MPFTVFTPVQLKCFVPLSGLHLSWTLYELQTFRLTTHWMMTDLIIYWIKSPKRQKKPSHLTNMMISSRRSFELIRLIPHQNLSSRTYSALNIPFLRRNGLSWISKYNKNISVYHFLYTLRPESLRSRLQSDLYFSHHHFRKAFKSFMISSIKSEKAFQIVDNGAAKSSRNKISKYGSIKFRKVVVEK